MARRTKRRIMADNYVEDISRKQQDKTVKSDNPLTSNNDNLFSGLVEDEIPDDEYMASAFIGRMQKTYVYDDIVKPYADSRGAQYDIVNRNIKSMYKMMVYNGSWGLEKLFTVLVMILKSNQDISRWTVGKTGGIYDNGGMPAGTLRGMSSKDFDFIVNDALKRRG
jgi:hypothetical protein